MTPELDVVAIADEAECELQAAGTPARAIHEKAYVKSSRNHAGASLPAIRAAANVFGVNTWTSTRIWSRFCTIADDLLDEREFFVRKAIGWVLREAGKRRPDLVVEFLTLRGHAFPA